MRHPGQSIGKIEDCQSELPAPREWINKEYIESKWNRAVVHYVWVFKIDSAVLDIITAK
jgi:hypothetical protein